MSLNEKAVAMLLLDDSAKRIINEGHFGLMPHKLVLEEIKKIEDFSDPDVQANMVLKRSNSPSCLLVMDSLTEDELINLDAELGTKNKGVLFSQIAGMLSRSKIDNTLFADRLLDKALKFCEVADNVFLKMRIGQMMDEGLQVDASDYDRHLMFRLANISPDIQVIFSEILIDRIKYNDEYSTSHTKTCLDILKQNDRLYDAVQMTVSKDIMDLSGKTNDVELITELSLAAYSGHDWIKPFVQSYLDIKDQETSEKTDLKAMITLLRGTKNIRISNDFREVISSKGVDFINKNIVDAEDLHALIKHDVIDPEKIQFDENTSSELKRARLSIDMGI